MNFVAQLQRAVLRSEIPATGRHILLTLAVKANWETGVIAAEYTPSLAGLAEDTGLSKSTIAEWLDVLDTAGWVKRERPPRASKDERTLYTLLIGSPCVPKPQRSSRRPASKASRPPGGPPAETDPAAPSRTSGPPGGPLRRADSRNASALPASSGPPGGPVRPADHSSRPPSGTPAVRLADASSPPGGPASIGNSPSESSTSGRRSARARPAARRPSGTAPADTSRGTRIPADFEPTDAMAWARRHTPNVRVRATTEAFIDHWTSQIGDKGERHDWQYEWRKWMRREQEFLERSPSYSGPARTAVNTTAAPTLAAHEICPIHRSGYRKDNCGPCRTDAYRARWDGPKPAHTEHAPAPQPGTDTARHGR